MMLNQWLAIALELRLLVVTMIGFVIGAACNRAIYSFVFRPRPLSPWLRDSHNPDLARRWFDRIPVIGWLFFRRTEFVYGRLFWARPLAIELCSGFGLGLLYWWETVEHGLMPVPLGANAQPILHAQFATHALLFSLLLVATFTDFDDRTIPDMITVPGTIAGMLILSLFPLTMLLELRWLPRPMLVSVLFAQPVPRWSIGPLGLALALTLLAVWSLALMNKTTTLRRGWKKGIEYFFVSLVRYRTWMLHLPLLLLLAVYTAWTWTRGAAHWDALLTSIIGLAVGGGSVWSVRVVGRHSFGMEAMGFGDVTLMAMIGSFLGWQAALVTFFLAPLTAVLVGSVQWLMTRDNRLAFGPYLSLAAVILVVFWDALWNRWLQPIFSNGLVVAVVLICSLPLLGVLMWLMRKLRG